MTTYQEELAQFKKWMKKQNLNTFEELQALALFGNYGYTEAVRRINAAQQSVQPTGLQRGHTVATCGCEVCAAPCSTKESYGQ